MMKPLRIFSVSLLVAVVVPISATAEPTPSPSPTNTMKVIYSAQAREAYVQAVAMAKSRFQLAVSDATAQLQEDMKSAGSSMVKIKVARAKYNASYQMAFRAMTAYIAAAKVALENSITGK